MGKNALMNNQVASLPKQCISGSENMFDRRQIIQKQQKLAQVYNRADPTQMKFYDKIKYQEMLFEVGDTIELYALVPMQPIVARLTAIIQVPVQRPFIEIQWLMKKKDLPEQLVHNYIQHISQAQVFPSDQRFYLYVQSIKDKCNVLSIAEYAQLGVTTEKIYFSRAYYDSTRKILEPAIEEWTTDCHCGMPTNPDLVYQECGVCERWFHVNCVEEYVDKNGGLCRECTNKRIVKIEID